MKKTLAFSILLACILLSGSSFAQSDSTATTRQDSMFNFSVKLGANIQSLSGKSWDNGYKPGIVGGIMVGVGKKKWGVRAEVLVSTASYTSSSQGVYVLNSPTDSQALKLRALYISIPVLIEYKIIPALKVQLGPQYSNLMSVTNVNAGSGDSKVFFKSAEFSAVAGLEATFAKSFIVGARYIMGLSDINNNYLPDADTWKNTTIQAYLGYRIR